VSQIKYNSKKHHLGYFDDEEQAARAYDTAARAHHKPPNLNFPVDGEKDGKGYGKVAADAKLHGLDYHREKKLILKDFHNTCKAFRNHQQRALDLGVKDDFDTPDLFFGWMVQMRGTEVESKSCDHCNCVLRVGEKTKGGTATVGFSSCGMDRVHSTLENGSKAPYTKDNVCFCCDDCQDAKSARDPNEYYDLCTRVHKAQKKRRKALKKKKKERKERKRAKHSCLPRDNGAQVVQQVQDCCLPRHLCYKPPVPLAAPVQALPEDQREAQELREWEQGRQAVRELKMQLEWRRRRAHPASGPLKS
jgi:hypothetical protein